MTPVLSSYDADHLYNKNMVSTFSPFLPSLHGSLFGITTSRTGSQTGKGRIVNLKGKLGFK